MEDSKILWYIVLGAIYFLSKAFGKKKQKPEPQQTIDEDTEYIPEEIPEKPQRTSFDDILRELTKSQEPEKREEPKPSEVEIVPIPTKPIAKEVSVPLPDQENEVDTLEVIDQERSKPIERDKPEFKRSEKFMIKEEQNLVAEEIHNLLSDVEGPKKAIILSEILNRKY